MKVKVNQYTMCFKVYKETMRKSAKFDGDRKKKNF